jgi:hypothetical protein
MTDNVILNSMVLPLATQSARSAMTKSLSTFAFVLSLLICPRLGSGQAPRPAGSGAAASTQTGGGGADTTQSSSSAGACKSTISGAIAYTDLKSEKVSLPYGTAFAITGDVTQVQLAGGALNALITPQSVTGDYAASDGTKGDMANSPVAGTSWNVSVGKLSPDTGVTINFRFTGPLSAGVVQAVLDEMLGDPAYQAALSQFIDSALGKSAAAQLSATTLLSQAAAAVVTSALGRRGLAPKNPEDLKTALATALLNNIEPIFNLDGQISSVRNPYSSIAAGLGLSQDDLVALPPQLLADKLKGIDYSKVSAAMQDTARQMVDQFLKTYQNAAAGLSNGLKGALFTGSSSLAVGSDQATDVVCDLQKYAGFDVGALYAPRLSELRSFAMVDVYLGPVQLRTGATPPKAGIGEWLHQRVSLAVGVALKDLSGSTQSKISGENAFAYGLGFRLNKYFRITAGGLLYRTTLPAENGSTSPANGSLRQEFFIGPSIDVTALSALQSIFAKAKSN